ncbi:hypothetical protein EJB05_54755, partial [Eragrostis curvula]
MAELHPAPLLESHTPPPWKSPSGTPHRGKLRPSWSSARGTSSGGEELAVRHCCRKRVPISFSLIEVPHGNRIMERERERERERWRKKFTSFEDKHKQVKDEQLTSNQAEGAADRTYHNSSQPPAVNKPKQEQATTEQSCTLWIPAVRHNHWSEEEKGPKDEHEEQQSKTMVMNQITVSGLKAWEMFKTWMRNQINRLQVVCGTGIRTDQLEQQQKRWTNYSLKVFMFAVTIFLAYLVSGSTSTSVGDMSFLVAIGAFFIADAALSLTIPPKWGSALVYLSWFLLVLLSYLLLVSFNKHYGFAILPVPFLIFAALLQRKFQPGNRQQQRSNDGDVDMESAHEDTDDEDSQHFDYIFDLSGGIVNCGGLITVVFGHYMVGPANAVGFLFFYTIALGLYLMMVATVRTVALTRHARYLAMMLKVLLVTTLIAALSHGIHGSEKDSDVSSNDHI